MKKIPLISFCIATYKRPEFVKATITSILKQNYADFEIVISEDNSEQSAEQVIKSFKSKKIIYKNNVRKLGMVNGYNQAISLAKGRFVTVLADDDPPSAKMLETFTKLYKKYPQAKAFFGASSVKISSQKISEVTHLKQGIHPLINREMHYGETKILNSQDFFRQFLRQELFPHYQWTASIIDRKLLTKINMVPDYHSAHFIDYAYLLKIAAETAFVIINKELAVFELHELSYGKKQDTLDEYKRGVMGFHKIVAPLAKKLNCQKEYEEFIIRYLTMFLVNRLEHYRIHKYTVSSQELFGVYYALSKKLPFLKKKIVQIYLKLTIYYRFTIVYHTINLLVKTYGLVKTRILHP